MDNVKNRVPVIILCGGIEVGFQDQFKPKACIKVNGMPLLYHTIKKYMSEGFTKFILPSGYGIEKISNLLSVDLKKLFLQDMADKISIQLVYTGGNNGTGSRICQCLPYINKNEENIAISYVDTYSDVNLKEAYQKFMKNDTLFQLTAVNQPTRFKVLGISLFDDYVKGIAQSPILDNNYVSGGYYFIKRKLLKNLESNNPSVDLSIENEILKKLIAEKKVTYYKHEGLWFYIDSQRDISNIENMILKQLF